MSTFPFVLLRKGAPFLLRQPREIEVLLPRPFPQVVLPRWRSRTHARRGRAHSRFSLGNRERKGEERRREQLKFPFRPFFEIRALPSPSSASRTWTATTTTPTTTVTAATTSQPDMSAAPSNPTAAGEQEGNAKQEDKPAAATATGAPAPAASASGDANVAGTSVSPSGAVKRPLPTGQSQRAI